MAVVVSSLDLSGCERAGEHLLTIANRSVWWSSAHTYKNAITNQLFLHTSANMYNRFGDSTYLANAQQVIAHRII